MGERFHLSRWLSDLWILPCSNVWLLDGLTVFVNCDWLSIMGIFCYTVFLVSSIRARLRSLGIVIDGVPLCSWLKMKARNDGSDLDPLIFAEVKWSRLDWACPYRSGQSGRVVNLAWHGPCPSGAGLCRVFVLNVPWASCGSSLLSQKTKVNPFELKKEMPYIKKIKRYKQRRVWHTNLMSNSTYSNEKRAIWIFSI